MAIAPKPDKGGLNTIVVPGGAFSADEHSSANHALRINMSMNNQETLERLALRIAVGLDGIYGLGQKNAIIERWQAYRRKMERSDDVPDFVKKWQYKPQT